MPNYSACTANAQRNGHASEGTRTAGWTIPLSENAKHDLRRSPRRDAKSYKHFSNLTYHRERRAFRLASLKAPRITPTNPLTPQELILLERIKKERARYMSMPSVRRELARHFPKWFTPPVCEKATFVLRTVWWHRAIKEAGGMAFRLNFSPKVLERAKASKKGLAQTLFNRIRDDLKKGFGREVPFWASLDITDDGRIHVQGGIVATDNTLPRLREALQRAGGKWAHRRGQDEQVWLSGPEYLTDEWARYSTRNTQRLEDETGQSAVYASGPIKRRAEALYGKHPPRAAAYARSDQAA